MECIIVDIDGTIADATHRLHLLPAPSPDGTFDPKAPTWGDFYKDAHLDSPIDEIVRIIHGMDVPVIICTGRDESNRMVTEAWLETHGVPYLHLMMRAAGDRRQDDLIKKDMLDKILEMGYKPLFALEDRSRVVKMWRANGIRTLQVCEGDY